MLALPQGTKPQIEREDAPGLVITRDVEDAPVQIGAKGAAAAMPVLHSPDCHITATVLWAPQGIPSPPWQPPSTSSIRSSASP
ncbi:hypothetical protein ACH4VR_04940 [Streptomyces sp. NPDC020883]|uniref:hypothetical protein n=1 Tax=Streptomyces sp. NPDC020883 TaxID=3365099 RepID=UPI0037B610F9